MTKDTRRLGGSSFIHSYADTLQLHCILTLQLMWHTQRIQYNFFSFLRYIYSFKIIGTMEKASYPLATELEIPVVLSRVKEEEKYRMEIKSHNNYSNL